MTDWALSTGDSTTSGGYTINLPEASEWECHLMPGYIVCPRKGSEPNWFWRQMQYLAFGFKWKKKGE